MTVLAGNVDANCVPIAWNNPVPASAVALVTAVGATFVDGISVPPVAKNDVLPAKGV